MTIVKQSTLLDFSRLEPATLQQEPFDYLLVPNVLDPEMKDAIFADFPEIHHRGSYPISQLTYGPVFQQLLDEMLGPQFEQIVAKKFNLDLEKLTTMVTVRGHCDKSDGKIHTDSKDKVISVLLYLNEAWESQGGQLRLLRSPDIEDYAVEIPPHFGTILLFRRCDYSYHGHKSYHGRCRAIQLNWVKNNRYKKLQQWRHGVSAWIKSLTGSTASAPVDDNY